MTVYEVGAYRSADFPLDHFGLVASPLITALLEQSGNKRKRKAAFNALVRVAKATKQIPTGADVREVGLVADKAGQLCLQFYFFESIKEAPSNAR